MNDFICCLGFHLRIVWFCWSVGMYYLCSEIDVRVFPMPLFPRTSKSLSVYSFWIHWGFSFI